jgi:hypothetical protein
MKRTIRIKKKVKHDNKYKGCCTKQRIKIPKVIWTLFNLGNEFACPRYFGKECSINDNANERKSIGIFNIIKLFKGL